MRTKNVECQLAQGQIGRYLSGDPLSKQAVAELERHIAGCSDCAAVLEERKHILRAMLTATVQESTAPKAVAPSPTAATTSAKTSAKDRLLDTLRTKTTFEPTGRAAVHTDREPAKSPSAYWKPLAYSAGLGIALFAMSQIMANPTAIFGGRAESEFSAGTGEPNASDKPNSKDDAKKDDAKSDTAPDSTKTGMTTAGSSTASPTEPPKPATASKTAASPASAGTGAPQDHKTADPNAAKPNPGGGTDPTSKLAPAPSKKPGLKADSEISPSTPTAIKPKTSTPPSRNPFRPALRAHRRAAVRPAPKRGPHGSVRVYDPSGKPVKSPGGN